jgi:hypothetical protein
MTDDRINELRAVLRDNPSQTIHGTDVRDALLRQTAALREHREPNQTPLYGGAFPQPITVRRTIVTALVIPGILGLAAMAAIVLPRGGHELTWPRLLSGCAAMVVIQFLGGLIAGRRQARRW